MCLVEIAGSPKPQAACALPVMPNMKIITDSPLVKKARESVMEFLLLNHPLDCPICDQGGECDRQDQSMIFGSDRSRMFEAKRGVEDKDLGPLVKTVMTRCIHCTRCIRFASEIAGVADRGTSGRGRETEVGTYISKVRQTEVSGNLVDLCPVGALTSKPTAFMTRPWERDAVDSVDVRDAMGSSVRAQTRGLRRMRVQPRDNDDINQAWLGDKSRYAIDGLTQQRRTESYVKGQSGLKPVTRDQALSHADKRRDNVQHVDRVVHPSLSTEQRRSASRLAQRREDEGKTVSRHAVGVASSPASSPVSLSSHVEGSMRSSLNARSEADRVMLVGFNPRREAPVRNLRLRESFLRDRTQVRTRGRALASGEIVHGLTYPTRNRGRTVETLTERREGHHPRSDLVASAQRPRIRVGPSVAGREDGAMRRQRRHSRSSTLRSEGSLTHPGSWKVLHQRSDRSNRTTAQARGWHSMELSSMTLSSSSALVLLGVGAADFVESGHVAPRPSSYSAMVAFHSHGDDRRGCGDVVVPIRSAYEEDGHFTNLEGRVQAHRASVTPAMSKGSAAKRSSLPWRPCDRLRSGSAASSSSLKRRERGVRSTHVSAGVGSSGVSTRSGGWTSHVTPAIHDYYLEGHVLARVSPTMAKCSQTLGVRGNFAV